MIAKQPKRIKLILWGEQMDAKQRAFEKVCCDQLNLKPGLFAIHGEKNRYLNDHIQWLWAQYERRQ